MLRGCYCCSFRHGCCGGGGYFLSGRGGIIPRQERRQSSYIGLFSTFVTVLVGIFIVVTVFLCFQISLITIMIISHSLTSLLRPSSSLYCRIIIVILLWLLLLSWKTSFTFINPRFNIVRMIPHTDTKFLWSHPWC